MNHDLKVMMARFHLRYDDILDTETRMDYKSFSSEPFECGRLWVSTDSKTTAAVLEMLRARESAYNE